MRTDAPLLNPSVVTVCMPTLNARELRLASPNAGSL